MKFLQTVHKFLNSVMAPLGIEIIRSRNKVLEMHLYQQSKRPKIPRYVNVGAGDFYHPLWHNLDIPNDYYAASLRGRSYVQFDLTSGDPLPFESGTVKAVYTSHVIEHLTNDNVAHLFREVFRCLEPGGHFRITCPDIDLEYDAYCRGDDTLWKEANAYGVPNVTIEQKFLDHLATILTITHPDRTVKKLTDREVHAILSNMPKEVALDFIINKIPPHRQLSYPADHINWFNHGKIAAFLESAQFECVYESKYGQSKCPLMRNTRLFDSTCPGLSLYVESRK